MHEGRYLLSKIGRTWKKQAQLELMVQKAPWFGDKRLSMVIYVRPPDKRKRDLDNLLKPLLDAMEGIVYDDDSQIDYLSIERMNLVKSGSIGIDVS